MERALRFGFVGLMLVGAGVWVCSCERQSLVDGGSGGRIMKETFGSSPDGQMVDLYTLVNSNGLRAKIMTYGGILVSLETPDRDGKLGDIVLGYESLAEYVKETPYFGALVGRYGNRIGKGRFTLDGVEYRLAINNGENHLHGGLKGFDKVVWAGEPVGSAGGVGLKLTYSSADGEEGYPGNLKCTVVYTLTDDDELKISYEAVTDKATVLNLTHHSYFCLAGQGKRDILGHELLLNADSFTPTDEGLIPTGEIRSVAGTPMDFRKATKIGARIDADYEPLKFGGGYDHNWVLNKAREGEMSLAAKVYEATSGRVMEIHTSEPGIQFYSGNFLDGTLTGKGGKVYEHRYGFCLETQHFPDSPNKGDFPAVILRPGETYRHETVHKFYTRK